MTISYDVGGVKLDLGSSGGSTARVLKISQPARKTKASNISIL